MIKKTIISILILAGLLISAINVNAYETTLTIDDGTNDILKGDEEGNIWENFSYPNIDIDELTCVQSGKKVEITLKLNETGEIEDSLLTTYLLTLITTYEHGGYIMTYNSDLVSELGGTGPILIMDGMGELVNSTTFSGVGTNTLSFSFNLKSTNERAIGIGALVGKTSGNYSYADNAPDDFDEMSLGMTVYPSAGGSYDIEVGDTLELSGDLEEGDASDYNWLWVFDDTSIELEGQNPTTDALKTKDVYTGRLYVYDDEGNWGLDVFEVNVTSEAGSDTSSNDEPGFELVLVVAAIAVALLLFRKKKK